LKNRQYEVVCAYQMAEMNPYCLFLALSAMPMPGEPKKQGPRQQVQPMRVPKTLRGAQVDALAHRKTEKPRNGTTTEWPGR
jgi:hypothetical protein